MAANASGPPCGVSRRGQPYLPAPITGRPEDIDDLRAAHRIGTCRDAGGDRGRTDGRAARRRAGACAVPEARAAATLLEDRDGGRDAAAVRTEFRGRPVGELP